MTAVVVVVVVVVAVDEGVSWRNEWWWVRWKLEAYHNWKDFQTLLRIHYILPFFFFLNTTLKIRS